MLRGLPGICFCLSLAVVAPSMAQEMKKDDIVKQLDPSTAISSRPAFRDPFKEKGIGETGEDPPPSVDLHLPFDYDSDKLTFDAITTLRQLGGALGDPKLAGYRFRIAGYTDAKGAADYNQKLSERRAQAVRDYLVAQYDVAPDRLQAIGYGLNQLADPTKPLDAINRRVQIVNMGEAKASQ
jgi:outer membrane protein OmpA-like peptidoglycan-associated protein